jgi:hypothetical protein
LKLFQLIRALHTTGRFARRLNGREKQTDQNPDDRDNDQQLDESKAAFVRFGNAHFTYFPNFRAFRATDKKNNIAPRRFYRRNFAKPPVLTQ